MRLLFDQNLSRALVAMLEDIFPGSLHVLAIGMERASDRAILEFAMQRGFAIVTKDQDFVDLATRSSRPPKVVQLATGNCTTRQVADLLRAHEADLTRFERSAEAVLVLTLG